MPTYSIWVLDKQDITVSGGGSLDGVTQGDGSHLVGRTLTLNAANWYETFLTDNDIYFDDNDSGQRLDGAQTINGTTYANGTVVEAEYRLTLRDPASGQTWDVIGYNVNNSSPAYGTIEALAFVGPPAGWPPVGLALQVIAAYEGPGYSGQPQIGYADFVNPPCFTPGTLIRTPAGERPVERLCAGDLVTTLDAGPRPLVAVLRTRIRAARFAAEPHLAPVRIRRDAFGPGRPCRDMLVSPQHRFLIRSAKADLMFGSPEVLVAACHLTAGDAITRPWAFPAPLTYLHLVFDCHHIVWSDGLESESFLDAGAQSAGVPDHLAAELAALFPDHAPRPDRLVRPGLRGWEARALAA